ncbi:siroheme synthase CysG [Devosia sp. 1566]|uniref:siroheme synthase CysG n=1 Tax=Devosia sp. 1566 TaxID=2499144 RepID=UPI000FDC09D8|nr:siroheme synthase CysG [Devosia sp. 1566]
MHIVPRQPSPAPRPRLAPLAVLPVFYRLAGKRVLLAGGSEAAAWKAELLAATGAKVEVHARPAELCEEMTALAETGQVRLVPGHWSAADWQDYAMAVGDCEDEAEAAAFAAAARRLGVPVNVIDKPDFCDFQFGSVVNRSPLVVGISTSGAAPILGQAVRQRIETMLPATLSEWAGLARRVRQRATDLLQPGAERRRFWQRLADEAFRTSPEHAKIDDWINQARGAQGGGVTLVGAGPGDAEFLTIKALRALQAADVILFDDLVSDEVLELARREAKRILVGKRGGRESCRQEDINRTMIALAKAGRHVVRLKSGDPMIFGRAGEEIAELEAAGVAVNVVPGITTALALASELKLSLTHRDCAQSVRFVTGHARNGQLPENFDWPALSDSSTTHIYYMAGRTCSTLVDGLLRHGMPAQTPMVLASNISRPGQVIVHSSLADAPSDMAQLDLSQPIIIAIGAAMGLRQSLEVERVLAL